MPPRPIQQILDSDFTWIACRLLITFMFWYGGVGFLLNFTPSIPILNVLGTSPTWLLPAVTILVLLAGSVLVILDRYLWLGAGMLATFTVLTIPLVHAFWKMTGDAAVAARLESEEHLAVIGALIAIEQSIQLQEAVESGIKVDCDATPEMLETIFFPNNAVHDGGVIIKGDRIAYAACIFPLTARTDLNKSLGTRHRAAIGLSEETDAVIVVVSEENGMISHAYKGQLVRGVTLEELRAFLTSVILRPARTNSIVQWLRARFSEHHKPAGPAVITRHEPRPAPKPNGK